MRPALLWGTRLRARAPPIEAGFVGPLRRPWREGSAQPSFLLLLGAVVLASLAVYGRTTAAVSWLLIIVIASAAGFLAVRSMLRTAQDPEPIATGGGFARETPGELGALAHTLGRARSGYAYSQIVVAARVASAFLEKVRLSRGLSPEEIERVRRDRARLRALIGDPRLADFVYENERYTREWPQRRGPETSKEPFGPALSRTLDAMEAWS